MSLLKELGTLLPTKIGDEYEYVNRGGCGIFAYMLAEELTRIGIKNEICWLAFELFDMEDFNKCSTLYELNNLGIRCVHVLVVVDGWFIDCEGVFKSPEAAGWRGYDMNIISDYKILERVVSNGQGWNNCFDRNQIPSMESDIKNIISNLSVKTW